MNSKNNGLANLINVIKSTGTVRLKWLKSYLKMSGYRFLKSLLKLAYLLLIKVFSIVSRGKDTISPK